MQSFDGIGSRDGQNLVAALQGGATEVIGRQVFQLQVGAGGPVKNQRTPRERGQIGVVR